MRFFNIVLFFAVIIAAVFASPLETGEEVPEVEPRVTCDIIGSDALCAARCIAMGYRGGFCNGKKICECRN